MPSKNTIGHIEIRAFAHATEDTDKVISAIRNTLPKDLSENIIFKKTNLTGHHKNPITLIETRFTDKNVLPTIVENIASNLNSLDKELLTKEIEDHLEKTNLYLRLDKQSAYLGEIKLATTDPIHFKIHFKAQNTEEIMEICRKTGLLP